MMVVGQVGPRRCRRSANPEIPRLAMLQGEATLALWPWRPWQPPAQQQQPQQRARGKRSPIKKDIFLSFQGSLSPLDKVK